MPLDIAQVGAALGSTILAALKSDSRKVKALALAEGEKLAFSLAKIAELLAQREIDREEAALLVKVQRDASEAVLASLAQISRVAARRAVMGGLKGVADVFDKAVGVPLLGALFAFARA